MVLAAGAVGARIRHRTGAAVYRHPYAAQRHRNRVERHHRSGAGFPDHRLYALHLFDCRRHRRGLYQLRRHQAGLRPRQRRAGNGVVRGRGVDGEVLVFGFVGRLPIQAA